MKTTKRVLFALLIAIITLMALSPLSVIASDGKDKGKPDALKIGDKFPLETGEARVYHGKNANNEEIWTVKLGEPVYIPGTATKYNCTWAYSNKTFTSRENDFKATVKDLKVTVSYNGKESTWTPVVSIGNKVIEPISTIATYTGVDPINENYNYNTIVWDYRHGIKRYLRIIEGMLIEYYTIDAPLNAELNIANNVIDKSGFNYHKPLYAYDKNHNPVEIIVDKHDVTLPKNIISLSKEEIEYPITIDPEVSFYTSSYNGWIRNDFYDTSSGGTVYQDNGELVVASSNPSGSPTLRDIARAFVVFDTSSIPDGSTISSADLYIRCYLDITDLNYDLVLQTGGATYPHTPLVLDDYNYYYYSGNGGSEPTTDPESGWEQLTLNATGIGWINKTGTTKFALRFSNDIANSFPIGTQLARYYSYSSGVGYRPYLTITYTAVAPSITANDASSITTTTARLNATVTYDGGESCQIRWGYGTTSQTADNFALYDTVSEWTTATWDTGETPYLDLSGLGSGDDYYYRVQVKNTNSTVTSGEINFTTILAITAPAITATSATSVLETSARLNATVTDDGHESCQIRWGYGTTSKEAGSFASYDTVTDWSSAEWNTGETPYLNVSSLASDDTYYYRVQIKNAHSTVTSGEINFTTGALVVTADEASNVGATTARINATVTNGGGESCQVRWGYGTTTQTSGNFASYDTVTEWTSASWATGSHPYLDISSLAADETYYYRVQLKSTFATVTSEEIDFTTEASFVKPTGFRAYPSSTTVSLSWTKGLGSTNTLIRYSLSGFPTTTALGTEAYEDTGVTYKITGLTPGKTYYFSAWGESDGTYTGDYATVAVTTYGFTTDEDEDMEDPGGFAAWFQQADYTGLSKLEPIYSAVNGVATNMGVPLNSAWMWLVICLIAIVSIAVFVKAGFMAGLVTSVVLILGGVMIHILPAWFLGFIVVFGMFGWVMKEKGNPA